MKVCKIIATLSLCALATVWAFAQGNGPTPPPAHPLSPPVSPFKGKVISVLERSFSKTSRSQQLKDVDVRQVGDRWFVVGTSVHPETEYWMGGGRVWFPVNDIQEIAEFQDMDEFNRRWQKNPGR